MPTEYFRAVIARRENETMSWLETRRTLQGWNREKVLFSWALLAAGLVGAFIFFSQVKFERPEERVFAPTDRYPPPGSVSLSRPGDEAFDPRMKLKRSPFHRWSKDAPAYHTEILDRLNRVISGIAPENMVQRGDAIRGELKSIAKELFRNPGIVKTGWPQ
jgi:hypothetical protein